LREGVVGGTVGSPTGRVGKGTVGSLLPL